MTEMNSKTEQVFQYSKQQASNQPTHDWSHTLRVWNIAQKIVSKTTQPVNLTVLELAVYLHDIGRQEEDESGGSINHAELGAQKAKNLLSDLKYPQNDINNVCHCIKAHRFRKNQKDQQPMSIEAKILFDADKIDSIGAVGIARAFLYAGENGYRLYRELPQNYDGITREKNPDIHTANIEYEVKLKKIVGLLLTDEGKMIAKERHQFMETFFERLQDEVEGRK